MKLKDESNVPPSLDPYFMSGILAITFKVILVFIPVNSGKTLKSTHLLYAHDIKDSKYLQSNHWGSASLFQSQRSYIWNSLVAVVQNFQVIDLSKSVWKIREIMVVGFHRVGFSVLLCLMFHLWDLGKSTFIFVLLTSQSVQGSLETKFIPNCLDTIVEITRWKR